MDRRQQRQVDAIYHSGDGSLDAEPLMQDALDGTTRGAFSTCSRRAPRTADIKREIGLSPT
jgi:hypothetical protein